MPSQTFRTVAAAGLLALESLLPWKNHSQSSSSPQSENTASTPTDTPEEAVDDSVSGFYLVRDDDFSYTQNIQISRYQHIKFSNEYLIPSE